MFAEHSPSEGCLFALRQRILSLLLISVMTLWLPAVRYPEAGPGYWDPVTSTLNWCEEVCFLTMLSDCLQLTGLGLLWIILHRRDREHSNEPMLYVPCIPGYSKLSKAWPRHGIPSSIRGLPTRRNRKFLLSCYLEVYV